MMAVFVAGCSNEKGHVVIPGVGTSDYQVGVTKVKAAIHTLGSGYRFVQTQVPYCEDCYSINHYFYPEQSLTIISYSDAYDGEQDLSTAVIENLVFEAKR